MLYNRFYRSKVVFTMLYIFFVLLLGISLFLFNYIWLRFVWVYNLNRLF